MSRGDLQEMEVGTKQSKTAVNANAKADAEALLLLRQNELLAKEAVRFSICANLTYLFEMQRNQI